MQLQSLQPRKYGSKGISRGTGLSEIIGKTTTSKQQLRNTSLETMDNLKTVKISFLGYKIGARTSLLEIRRHVI